jgi:xanthine dehydrogenase molybdopterin-binding subunit B
MLAISVFSRADRRGGARGRPQVMPNLDAPATPERILAAVTTSREGRHA